MKNLISAGTLRAGSNHGQDGSVARDAISAREITGNAAGIVTILFLGYLAKYAKTYGIPGTQFIDIAFRSMKSSTGDSSPDWPTQTR